ncbi:MAG: rhomboid family intramembrane serine protease [Candidatus Riflebacteria bacterium]|nr:rhomboid family intramembrane serine protease [Candidatus Riflebacteria bacterium]
MIWLNRLEQKYGHWGLEGLIRYVSMLMLLVFFLDRSGMLPYHMLYLNRDAIISGEVWRLFTFLLIPFSDNMFFLIFELSILVMCADGLEAKWGTFKLTAYYLTGAISNILVVLIMPEVQIGSYYIYMSLFLGFATVYPDYEILLFFILPVKIKYLAMISGALMLYNLVFAPVFMKIAIALSVGNYLLFFSQDALATIRHNRRQYARSAEYEKSFASTKDYRHQCSTCGITDVSNPEAQFRYCTCPACGENGVPFCSEHLKEHKQNNSQHQN